MLQLSLVHTRAVPRVCCPMKHFSTWQVTCIDSRAGFYWSRQELVKLSFVLVTGFAFVSCPLPRLFVVIRMWLLTVVLKVQFRFFLFSIAVRRRVCGVLSRLLLLIVKCCSFGVSCKCNRTRVDSG